jgi:hypothetical protein
VNKFEYFIKYRILFALLLIVISFISGCSSEGGNTGDSGLADISQGEPDGVSEDGGGEDIGTFQSRLTRYPYITYRGNNSFTLFWETDHEEMGYVRLGDRLYKVPPSKLSIKVGSDLRTRTVYQYSAKFDILPEDRKLRYEILSLKTPFGGSFSSRSTSSDFVFAVYGDNRSGAPYLDENPTHKEITSLIAKYEPEFVINTGDIVYAGGLESEWYQFFNDGAALFKDVPLFVAIGNHESGGCDIFSRQFDFPNGDKLYYSFDWGNSHFIVLCIDCGISTDTEQYRWLKEDIETADSNPNVRHLFVVFHEPPYTFSAHAPNMDARNYIVPLLKTTRTRLVVNGHNHTYEHMFKDGIHYLVSGGGGAPLYPEKEVKYEEGETPYMVKYQMVFNFSIIHVTDKSINVRSFDNSNQLIEEFNITEE